MTLAFVLMDSIHIHNRIGNDGIGTDSEPNCQVAAAKNFSPFLSVLFNVQFVLAPVLIPTITSMPASSVIVGNIRAPDALTPLT
jgi:hypothetical protein